MSDHPHPPDAPSPNPPSALGSRIQARLDDLDAGVTAPPSRTALAPDPVWTGRPSSSPVEDLNRQLEVLRGQLDDAFDDLEGRLDDAESRASVAEARASVAESRASAAEARIAEAEANADDAHTRLDHLLMLLRDGGQDASTPAGTKPTSDLRSALDRLRSRLDV